MGKIDTIADVLGRLDVLEYRADTGHMDRRERLDLVWAMYEAGTLLRRIVAMAGNPDPAEGCRLIIRECKKALGARR